MTATLAKEVGKLTAAEKIRLIEQLWDEVATQPDALPVPAAHKRMLRKRLDAQLKSSESIITLEEFRDQLNLLLSAEEAFLNYDKDELEKAKRRVR